MAIKAKNLDCVKKLIEGENVDIGKSNPDSNRIKSNLDLALKMNAKKIAGVLIENNATITAINYIHIIKNQLLAEKQSKNTT